MPLDRGAGTRWPLFGLRRTGLPPSCRSRVRSVWGLPSRQVCPSVVSGLWAGDRALPRGEGGRALHFKGLLLIGFCTHTRGVVSADSGDESENNGIVIPGIQMFILPPFPLLSRGDGINRTCLLTVSASFCARGQQAITTSCSGTVITARGGRGGLWGGGCSLWTDLGRGPPCAWGSRPGVGPWQRGVGTCRVTGSAGHHGCHCAPGTIFCPWTQERFDGIEQPQKVFKKPYSKSGREGNVLSRRRPASGAAGSTASGGPRGQCRRTRHDGPRRAGR